MRVDIFCSSFFLKQHTTFQEIAAREMEFFRALIIHGWKIGEVAPRSLAPPPAAIK